MVKLALLCALFAALACTSPPIDPPAGPPPTGPPEATTLTAEAPPESASAPADSRAFLARRHAAEAEDLLAIGKLDASLENLRVAEKLAPDDREVLGAARRIRGILGIRSSHLRDPLADAVNRARIETEMNQELARLELDRGRRALAAGDALGARRHAEQVQVLMRLHPEIDWSSIQPDIEALAGGGVRQPVGRR